MRKKKKWIKPQLIVLKRGNPEEFVLGACKGNGGGGYSSAEFNCSAPMYGGGYCWWCDATTGS